MNLIFDFDGTLCDSLDESIIIVNQFLKIIGKPQLTRDLVRRRGIKQMLLDNKVPMPLLPVFMLYYRWQAKKRITNMPIFPGMENTIKTLSHKHTLGIVTSNSVGNVMAFLARYRLEKYFQFVDSELSLVAKDKKVATVIKTNNLDKSLTYYIGDETRDIQAMKKINVPMIAVTWGLEDAQLLKAYKPFMLIDEPKELLSMEKQLRR